jgi:hypothetical protein
VNAQRWWATRPWPVYFVTSLAAMLAFSALFDWIYYDSDIPTGRIMLTLSPVTAVALTVLLVVRRRRERKSGVFELRQAAGEAMRHGRVPADPRVRAEMLRMLPAVRQTVSPRTQWVSAVPGLLALSQVFTALDHPRHWLLVAFFAGIVVLTQVSLPRQRRRLDAVERGLRSVV